MELTPAPAIDAETPAADFVNATYSFAQTSILIIAGFGLVLLSVFIIVIAPLLAKMLPPEVAGVVGAVSDVALDTVDAGIDQLKAKLSQNGVTWDDELLNVIDTWLDGKRQESANDG